MPTSNKLSVDTPYTQLKTHPSHKSFLSQYWYSPGCFYQPWLFKDFSCSSVFLFSTVFCFILCGKRNWLL